MLRAEAHVRLGVLLAANGQLSGAVEHLGAARQLDPDNHTGIRLEGEILWASGSRADAVRRFLPEHLDSAPLDLEYRRRLAEMAREQNDTAVLLEVDTQARRLTQALAHLLTERRGGQRPGA